MRAVTGTVNSTRQINLSTAATVLSQFAAGVGDSQENASYLRRASSAVNELVQLGFDVGQNKKVKKKRGEKRGSGEEIGEVVDSVRKKHRLRK